MADSAKNLDAGSFISGAANNQLSLCSGHPNTEQAALILCRIYLTPAILSLVTEFDGPTITRGDGSVTARRAISPPPWLSARVRRGGAVQIQAVAIKPPS